MKILALALLAAQIAAPEVTVGRLDADAADAYLSQRPTPKKETPVAKLLLPFFRVDTNNTDGETTFFAVRNSSAGAVEIEVRYYAPDRPHTPQFTTLETLAAQQVRTFNVRDVPDPVVDIDGFATGYVIIEATGGETVLHGDTFQLNPDQAFATGEQLVDIDPQSRDNGLCSVFTARFLNGGGFDGGTLFNIWLDADVQPDPSEPILFYTVYNQAGDLRFVGQLAADQVAFQVPVSQLTAPMPTNFGVIELEFADTVGHVSLVMSALDLYSVGFDATCTE